MGQKCSNIDLIQQLNLINRHFLTMWLFYLSQGRSKLPTMIKHYWQHWSSLACHTHLFHKNSFAKWVWYASYSQSFPLVQNVPYMSIQESLVSNDQDMPWIVFTAKPNTVIHQFSYSTACQFGRPLLILVWFLHHMQLISSCLYIHFLSHPLVMPLKIKVKSRGTRQIICMLCSIYHYNEVKFTGKWATFFNKDAIRS